MSRRSTRSSGVRYDTRCYFNVRAQKPTRVSLIYRTERFAQLSAGLLPSVVRAGATAPAPSMQQRRHGTALSGKRGQCHADSRVDEADHRRLVYRTQLSRHTCNLRPRRHLVARLSAGYAVAVGNRMQHCVNGNISEPNFDRITTTTTAGSQ